MTAAATTTIMLVTIIGVSSVALGGYYYLEQSATTSSTPSPTASPAAQAEATPSSATESPTPTPTEQNDRDAQVQGIISTWPTPTTMPRVVRPTPTPTPNVASQRQGTTGEIDILFVDTPSTVTSGQSFTVKWQATGPANMRGEETSLALSYEAQKTNGNSSSRTSSNNSTSFGSFVGPKTFSSNFSFGGASGDIKLTATAIINGETVTAHKTIALVN